MFSVLFYEHRDRDHNTTLSEESKCARKRFGFHFFCGSCPASRAFTMPWLVGSKSFYLWTKLYSKKQEPTHIEEQISFRGWSLLAVATGRPPGERLWEAPSQRQRKPRRITSAFQACKEFHLKNCIRNIVAFLCSLKYGTRITSAKMMPFSFYEHTASFPFL